MVVVVVVVVVVVLTLSSLFCAERHSSCTNSTKRVITADDYHSKSTFHVSNQTEQDRTIHTIFT